MEVNKKTYYEFLIQHSEDVIIFYNKKLEVKFALGHKLLEKLGYEYENIVGKELPKAFKYLGAFQKILWRQSVEGVKNTLKFDFKDIFWEFSFQPVFDDKYRIVGGVTIWRDITIQQKKLNRIHQQRNKISEISHKERHEVAGLAATIQGLIPNIFDVENPDPELIQQLITNVNNLKNLANELSNESDLIIEDVEF